MEIILELPDAKVDDLLNLCDILAELSKRSSSIQNGRRCAMTKNKTLSRELDFIENLILGAHAKLDANKESMPEEDKKKIEERLEILYTIGKIVQAEEYRMTEKGGKSLAGVMGRIIDGSASAHLTNDKDGQIEVTVYDSVCGSGAIAKLEFHKIRADLIPKATYFYQ